MFGKYLKKKFGEGKAEIAKVENRDLMQAIVGGCLLVASADGSIGQDEISSLEKQLANTPSLKHFGGEINETVKTFQGQLEANFRLGKLHIMREIEDVKGNSQDSEEVFVNMLAVAEADGEVEPQELDILKEVASTLGVRFSDFGITS